MDGSNFKPFYGYQTSIIPFSGGYYFYLASWDRTPVKFPNARNVWLVTPEGKKLLFADPPASSEIVCLYHQFHEIFGASIKLDWISENDLHIYCQSLDDAYRIDVDLQLKKSMASRLLVALGGGPPTPFRLSKPMVAISNALLNLMVAKGGGILLGKTETGQPFYHGNTEIIFEVVGGTFSINGKDLGSVCRSTRPVTFGDAVPYTKAVLKLGTLFIPYDEQMVRHPNLS